MISDYRVRQSGLTIVELMVALLITSILIAGIIGLFIGTRKTRTADKHMNQVATNARFFTTFISHDIRMAGYRGSCGKFKSSKLAWSKSKQRLTIRYCKKKSNKTNSHYIDTIRYYFNRSSKCSQTGGNSVCYTDSKSNSRQQLINGLHLHSHGIWYGIQKKSGKITYRSAANGLPNFKNLETVRLRFKVKGNNLTQHQLKTGNYVIPEFDFVVNIRNNKS